MIYLVYAIFSLISLFELVLVARAIFSWLPSLHDTKVYELVYRLTEPLLQPIRDFLFRFDFFRRLPIDFSMLILFLLTGAFSRLLLLILF